jgi:hypothetical protein
MVVLAGKVDRLERMTAYVKTYGVDRSFLSLCNYNDVLNKSFNLSLPATESFDAKGDVNSPESVAALEGFGEAMSKAYDWIKKQLAAIRDFFAGLWKKFIGLFKKNEESAKAASAEADKAIKEDPNAAKKPVENKEDMSKIKEAAQQAAQSEVLGDATKSAAAKVAADVEKYEKAGTVEEAKKALDAVTADTSELAKAANNEANTAQATAKQAAQAAEQIVAKNKGQAAPAPQQQEQQPAAPAENNAGGAKPTEQVKKASLATKAVALIGKTVNSAYSFTTKGFKGLVGAVKNLKGPAKGQVPAALEGTLHAIDEAIATKSYNKCCAKWLKNLRTNVEQMNVEAIKRGLELFRKEVPTYGVNKPDQNAVESMFNLALKKVQEVLASSQK